MWHPSTFLLALSGLVLAAGSAIAQSRPSTVRLKRSESFFGLHFDFHAGPDCTEVGKTVDRQMVEFIIDQVGPDYIQVDSKGHPGFSSYPTRVGNPAPGFVRDPLEIWRAVTRQKGVALYTHYSGVMDARAIELRPDWAAMGPDGPSKSVTSVFSSYVDELLIPQLKELSDVYHTDGVWVDGECWGTIRDYSDRAAREFRRQTGFKTLPKEPGDPGWYEFSEFHREAFRKYLEHYVTELHKHNPAFQIASNWAYSSLMPEEPKIPVDFISGDFSPLDSVNSARLEGRVMAVQGLPWDLMAWGFTAKHPHAWSHMVKSVIQVEQEAAIVLALGGGFQLYLKQKRDGSVYRWTIELPKGVSKFCRARQAFCHKAKSVPQIGLLLSTDALYRVNKKLFASWSGELNPFKGILYALLDGQNVVDIVMEHTLRRNITQYPLLIYPEWGYVSPELKRILLDYVVQGGNLLVLGPRSASHFREALEVTLLGTAELAANGLEMNQWLTNIHSLSQKVRLGEDVQAFGRFFDAWNKAGVSQPAASITNLGKGRIAATYLELGESYHASASHITRDFLKALVDQLFQDPKLRVSGSHYVDVTLNRKSGNLNVNLVNTAGPHSDDTIWVFDEIPPVGPLTVEVQTPSRPAKITLQPTGTDLRFDYQNGVTRTVVPRLDIHCVLVIEL